MRAPAAGPGRTWQLALGLLLLVGSTEVPRRTDGPRAPDVEDEALARALMPLGPVRALVSSALWVELLHQQMRGDAERTAALSRALLAVHPGLHVVREYLAGQLIVTEAPRAPDRARHAALVAAGLQFFEDGLARDEAQGLHGALGRTLAVQPEVDPRFAAAAEAFFGDDIRDRAIDELRASRPSGLDAWLLAQLLADRGVHVLDQDADVRSAARDLSEAAGILAGVSEASVEQREQLLVPLRQALADPMRRAAPAFDPEDGR